MFLSFTFYIQYNVAPHTCSATRDSRIVLATRDSRFSRLLFADRAIAVPQWLVLLMHRRQKRRF